MPLTSANSINVGRLLPQMVYYFHAIAELRRQAGDVPRPIVCTPSGNFGNLTAGSDGAPRRGAYRPIHRRDQHQRRRAPVPAERHVRAAGVEAHDRQRDGRRQPEQFRTDAVLVQGDREALSRDVAASVHEDVAVKATIKDVFDRRGYLLDPHSAIGYLGIKRTKGIFLATAHPAKFSEIVEPVIGRAIERPEPLAKALEKPRQILRLDATLAAVKDAVGG